MLNDFTKIVAGAVTVLLAGGLALGTTQHQPATASRPGSARHITLDSASSAPLIGSSISSSATLAQETSQFGTLPIVRVYYPGLPAADAWSTGLAEANNSAVIVSFKANPAAILSGSDNTALQRFFDTAPTGHRIYYSYFHEPEDNIAAGQFTAAAYRKAWGRIAAIADAAHNPDLRSTLILMAYDLQASSHRNWRDYLPGGNVISTLGWDAYPAGSADGGTKELTPPAQFMGPAVAASHSAGLPFGFSEFGTSVVSGRAAWLTSVGKYLMSSGALFGTLFDSAGPTPSMRLTNSASINAWGGVVGRSDNANNIRHR
ncbi:MAG: hypothetical protein ABSA03_12680 [Streptosporangiaceae bacterium]|jgi:hypothetical protein